ncbi:RNA-binding S4 domain-containing protein [Entomomonas asaccharolytica]|uniref:Heat shock protein 15 n=1 Tax=Entomomonas asaccharolytica TaxID=2785331 RepID=A0A974NF10_9GAMM|nr:S4 domain-containing protein [Entomomonas asaccharolytica]QQP85405.1 RNA-binding protein [Entomomonas asaccharolytica]
MTEQVNEQCRLDKWLWAARFFKTRIIAKEAIAGGKVHCQGERCKPSKNIRIGDELTIRIGYDDRVVIVKELSEIRKGASDAQMLYQETAESVQKRQQAAIDRKLGMQGIQTEGRPTKKQRRQIHQFRQSSN